MKLYPRSEKMLSNWSKRQWKRFEERIFDVSEFMRNIQSAFARWYNRQYHRKGRFWADRFKSTLLADGEAVLDAILYVDLNPVRAGLVDRPEEFAWSSAWARANRKARWMMSLSAFMDDNKKQSLYEQYRQIFYWRGAIRTKAHQSVISQDLLDREMAKGHEHPGSYAESQRYFIDGMVVGGEVAVRKHLEEMRSKGKILRRKNPVEQVEGRQFSLREQRTTFVPLR